MILAWRTTACNREIKSLQPDYWIRNIRNTLERETQWPTALICSWHIDDSFRKYKICNLLYVWNSIFSVGKHIAKPAWLEQRRLKAECEDANTAEQTQGIQLLMRTLEALNPSTSCISQIQYPQRHQGETGLPSHHRKSNSQGEFGYIPAHLERFHLTHIAGLGMQRC